MGICNAYLAEKAYGYFGSTTIAYGPDDHNDNADLICQYYFKHLFSGSSSGRAALQARLDFIAARSPLDPYNAKTLGQYILIGDPSIHPVVSSSVTHALAGVQPRRGKAQSRRGFLPVRWAGPLGSQPRPASLPSRGARESHRCLGPRGSSRRKGPRIPR